MRSISIIILFVLVAGNVNAQNEWQKHNSPVDADLHNIFFANDSVGWIVTHNTGTILHTKDEGESWSVQADVDSMYFEDVYFLDEKTGWVSGEHGLVFKTIDGGKNWARQQIADKISWIYSLHFFDENRAVAVGVREERPATLFLKTTDGGKNWNNIRNKVPSSFYGPGHILNKQKGFVAGADYILSTDDAGNTWKKQFTDTTSNADCGEAIRGLTFVTSETGWAVGHCGLVLKTEDGQNWERQEKFTKNRLRSVAFVTKSEGYIVGDSNREPGVLYRTTDGGKTWQTVLDDAPELHRIELTEQKIWLVGDNGTILSKSR